MTRIPLALGFLALVIITLPLYIASVLLALPYLLLHPVMARLNRMGERMAKERRR